jgi:hypothetical protein
MLYSFQETFTIYIKIIQGTHRKVPQFYLQKQTLSYIKGQPDHPVAENAFNTKKAA